MMSTDHPVAFGSTPFSGRVAVTERGVPHPVHEFQANHTHVHSLSQLVSPGIFQDTLLPSFALHSGLAVLAYATGRATDRLEAKDWLWPLGPVINAWWSSVGRRVAAGGVTLPAALEALSRPERLLLAGVTLWGGRLFYRLASRSARRDSDEPRYEAAKKSEGAQSLWNKAFFTTYLPEAAFQTIISLPFSATFRHQGPVLQGASSALQSVAIGLFGTGLALEVLADWQLEKFRQAGSEDKICREGVWSIVRHPNYLGDIIVHFSFPILLYASDLLTPVALFGPIANYLFLRYIGGDKENEQSQLQRYSEKYPAKKADFDDYRSKENSVWPRLDQVTNPWLWAVAGAGVATVLIEGLSQQWL
ncbi:hypothetical protein NKR23_g5926 [Pleurostoma richardsiae]|uniref:Steroid 5-alpha reductase C-terminal domain-containing protein n=1 Tax=Pleurostoma richardsiae TaxID=41990 RepID=A0AA38RFF8_9PEZI|nr:hypothetical protein NKR23_g5926 [Pleurostoma richardsiae]